MKVQSFRLIMENNFIQMASSAGHAVQTTRLDQFLSTLSIVCIYISPMASGILSFKAPIVSGFDGIILIFDGIPQIIVQRCLIAAPRWPNDNSSAADNAIFENRVQNIECSFGSYNRPVETKCCQYPLL